MDPEDEIFNPESEDPEVLKSFKRAMRKAQEYAENHLLDQETVPIREMLTKAFFVGTMYGITEAQDQLIRMMGELGEVPQQLPDVSAVLVMPSTKKVH